MSTKEEENSSAGEMTFWGHLDALRAVLWKAAVVLVGAAVVLFAVMPDLFDRVILAPCRGDFVLYRLFAWVTAQFPGLPQFTTDGFSVQLINIQLASQFFIHMSTSFWLALVVTFPVLIYLLWTFIRPALYAHEQRGVRIAFLFGTVMFFLGVAVGYFVVFPVTLIFLAEYHVSAIIPNQISLDSYMDTFVGMLLVMGLVFELPLVAFTLSAIGILHRSTLRRYRRHAIVVLLVAAAFITPTGDPFTLAIVFLPLYLLYEVSILIVKREKTDAE